MKYTCLLRGINVGGHRKVEMKRLRALAEALGYTEVSTYLNSGNLIFSSVYTPDALPLEQAIEKEFGFPVAILIKSSQELRSIVEAIPSDWENDTEWKVDVAYLFPSIDSSGTIDKLPIKKEYVDIHYTPGAIFWRIRRDDLGKSQLAKLASHKIYQEMTIRNINTARYLGGL